MPFSTAGTGGVHGVPRRRALFSSFISVSFGRADLDDRDTLDELG